MKPDDLTASRIEAIIRSELKKFPSKEAVDLLIGLRVPADRMTIVDAFNATYDVVAIARSGTLAIAFRDEATASPDRWLVLGSDVPVADFSWYLSLWDALLASGLWPTPPGYTFE
jgi:hypothetical protein